MLTRMECSIVLKLSMEPLNVRDIQFYCMMVLTNRIVFPLHITSFKFFGVETGITHFWV